MLPDGNHGGRGWSAMLPLVRAAVWMSVCAIAMSMLTLTPSGARALRALAGQDRDPGVPTE
jgi:hypothetical protein